MLSAAPGDEVFATHHPEISKNGPFEILIKMTVVRVCVCVCVFVCVCVYAWVGGGESWVIYPFEMYLVTSRGRFAAITPVVFCTAG